MEANEDRTVQALLVSEAAVEAAARALSIHTMVDDSPENEKFREAVRIEARRALEAADALG